MKISKKEKNSLFRVNTVNAPSNKIQEEAKPSLRGSNQFIPLNVKSFEFAELTERGLQSPVDLRSVEQQRRYYKTFNTSIFNTIAIDAFERDATVRHIFQSSVFAIMANELKAAAADGSTDRDLNIMKDVQENVLNRDWVLEKLPTLHLAGLFTNAGCAEIIWGIEKGKYVIKDLFNIPINWVCFNPDNPEEIMFLPAEMGTGKFQTLEDWKLLVHSPNLTIGNKHTGGFSYTITSALIQKRYINSLWLVYLEKYSQPVVLAKVDNLNPNPEQVQVDQAAIVNGLKRLTVESFAVLPKSAELEFLNSNGTSTVDNYIASIKYIDDNITKLVLNSAITSDTKGSLELGQIHNLAKAEFIKSQAKLLANTVRKAVEKYVRFNYGDNAKVPNIYFDLKNIENTVALVDSLAKLLPHGLEVSQSEIQQKLGLNQPKEGEKMLETINKNILPQAVNGMPAAIRDAGLGGASATPDPSQDANNTKQNGV